MNIKILTLCVFFYSFQLVHGFTYEERIPIGNDLFKVKSGDYYGIINSAEDVIVSIEYQDICYREGKALLTKDDVLHAWINEKGESFPLPHMKCHPRFRYIYEDYIIVAYEHNFVDGPRMVYGFINSKGELMRFKKIGAYNVLLGSSVVSLFDNVSPFVDGVAVVVGKNGFKHVDRNGNERFALVDKMNKATFRSSVKDKECIIVSNDGINLYQESKDGFAMVKRRLSPSATYTGFTADSNGELKLEYKEGIITLDSTMCVVSYENESGILSFGKTPEVMIVDPPLEVSFAESIELRLINKYLQANEKGRAIARIKVKNNSDTTFESVVLKWESFNVSDKSTFTIGSGEEKTINVYLPAQFSSPVVTRKIRCMLKYKDETLEGPDLEYEVFIKRYSPEF